VWMVRANWGWKGRASEVATSTAELQAIRDKFSVLPADWKKPTSPRVIGSEYIQNPLLWKGYKFHVRVHIIVTVTKEKRYAVMAPSVEMIPAGKPFVNGEYADQDIHDTHDDRNIMSGFIPGDIENGQMLYDGVVKILKESIPELLPLLELYPEAENSYDVFGVDIMFLSDGTPIILEINSTPGLLPLDDPRKFINDEITNAIFATSFSDLFYPAGDKSKIIYL